MRGGKSKAEVAVVTGGANGSAHALKITGKIESGLGQHWAGILFSPGPQPFSAANLSGKAGISFWARGDGKPAYLMVFSQARGYIPTSKTFVAGREWKRFQYDWKDFDGLDGAATLGIFLGGGVNPGPFELQIDDVQLERAKSK
jgi:hypothetical protein